MTALTIYKLSQENLQNVNFKLVNFFLNTEQLDWELTIYKLSQVKSQENLQNVNFKLVKFFLNIKKIKKKYFFKPHLIFQLEALYCII